MKGFVLEQIMPHIEPGYTLEIRHEPTEEIPELAAVITSGIFVFYLLSI